MKIKNIQVHMLKKHLSTSMRISRGGFKIRRHCIIQITTHDDVYGLGEGVGNPDAIAALIEKCIAPLLIGKNSFAIEAIRDQLLSDTVYYERGGSWICAVSAIEMALWDIKGKYLKCPVYELLGGSCHQSLEVYASNVYWYEDVKLVGREIEDILKKDIKNIKIHTGVLPPKEELRRLKELSSLLCQIDKFMIDLNGAYSLSDAILATNYFVELEPFWLEEPLKLACEEQLHRIRSISRIPIAYGENILTIDGFKRMFSQDAIDVAMPDLARVGGLLSALDILALGRGFGVTVSYHNFSSGVLLAATMHVMMARNDVSILEYDSSSNAIIREFFPQDLKLYKGNLTVSAEPGLGVLLTDEVLRYKV